MLDDEVESLEHDDAFTFAFILNDKKLVGGKQVHTVKSDPENPNYKPRYVAKGYSQDYEVLQE